MPSGALSTSLRNASFALVDAWGGAGAGTQSSKRQSTRSRPRGARLVSLADAQRGYLFTTGISTGKDELAIRVGLFGMLLGDRARHSSLLLGAQHLEVLFARVFRVVRDAGQRRCRRATVGPNAAPNARPKRPPRADSRIHEFVLCGPCPSPCGRARNAFLRRLPSWPSPPFSTAHRGWLFASGRRRRRLQEKSIRPFQKGESSLSERLSRSFLVVVESHAAATSRTSALSDPARLRNMATESIADRGWARHYCPASGTARVSTFVSPYLGA